MTTALDTVRNDCGMAGEEVADMVDSLEKENDQLREQVTLLRYAATRAHIKLSAYVGVCTGDKELTNTIIPMLKEALAATEPKP